MSSTKGGRKRGCRRRELSNGTGITVQRETGKKENSRRNPENRVSKFRATKAAGLKQSLSRARLERDAESTKPERNKTAEAQYQSPENPRLAPTRATDSMHQLAPNHTNPNVARLDRTTLCVLPCHCELSDSAKGMSITAAEGQAGRYMKKYRPPEAAQPASRQRTGHRSRDAGKTDHVPSPGSDLFSSRKSTDNRRRPGTEERAPHT